MCIISGDDHYLEYVAGDLPPYASAVASAMVTYAQLLYAAPSHW
jgi:hypothetical protein